MLISYNLFIDYIQNMDKDKVLLLIKYIQEVKELSFSFCEDESEEVSLMAQRINHLAAESKKILERNST